MKRGNRMIAQFTLTVPEGKRFIAKAVASMPPVRRARFSGKVLLKGGTTVSAVSEEIGGPPLRISGRITPDGARAAADNSDPHCIVIEKGTATPVDDKLELTVESMGPRDVAIIGANLIDHQGGAAILAGGPLGGAAGKIISGLAAQGVQVIIACGVEKMGPGLVQDAIAACGRSRVTGAMGMAVGLVPLHGTLVTEVQACSLLARVNASVIACGGVFGAEGGTTLVCEGDEEELAKLISIVKEVKGTRLSGAPRSFMDCVRGNPACSRHMACDTLYSEILCPDTLSRGASPTVAGG